MLVPVVAAALIFGGFVLADKLRKAKVGNAMTLTDDVEWVEVDIYGKKYLVGRDYYGGPLSTGKAQRIAKSKGWVLPTPDMVDAIWKAADLKLAPITAGTMNEVNKGADKGQYERHARLVSDQIEIAGGKNARLFAGHSKDVVMIFEAFGKPVNKVGIYGWHDHEGVPIQKPMWGHGIDYEDYSQRLRPVMEA